MTDDTKAIARCGFDAFMEGDLGALRQLLAPQATLHQCGFLQPIPAASILNREFPRLSPLEDRQVKLERMVAEGNLVALHWTTTARYNDPATPEIEGKTVSFPSMSFIRVEDGKIAEIWNIQDTTTMQMQLSREVGSGT